jgi:branched-chain amino acid transport system substrate-binding protein
MRRPAVLPVFLAALLCVSCVTSPAPVPDDGALVIGFIADLSGRGAHEGSQALATVRIRVEGINGKGGIGGRMIRLEVRDGGSGPIDSVGAYELLARELKASAVIAPWAPNICLAISAASESVKVPVVSHCADPRCAAPGEGGADGPRRFFFLSRPAAADSGTLLAGFTSQVLGLSRLAAVSRAGTPSSTLQARAFESAARLRSLRSFSSFEVDGDLAAAAVLEKLRRDGTEAVLFCLDTWQFFAPSASGGLLGFRALLGDERWPGPDAAPPPEGSRGVYSFSWADPEDQEIQDFTSEYTAAVGEVPGLHALAARDDVDLVLDAAARAGSREPAALRDALETAAGRAAPWGPFSMSGAAHRPSASSLVVLPLDEGRSGQAKQRYVPRVLP